MISLNPNWKKNNITFINNAIIARLSLHTLSEPVSLCTTLKKKRILSKAKSMIHQLLWVDGQNRKQEACRQSCAKTEIKAFTSNTTHLTNSSILCQCFCTFCSRLPVVLNNPQGTVLNSWSAVWVVLSEDGLDYYKKKTDHSPKGMIPLKGATLISPCQDFNKRTVRNCQISSATI